MANSRVKSRRLSPNKAGQAAIELAVFGAILIFILGGIIRSATSNSYTQDQDFKAMRKAMLLSWETSWPPKTPDAEVGTVGRSSRNSSSITFLEDRLSPDFNKYGNLDRTPYLVSGSGTFTYRLMYPLDASEVQGNLPIMDLYIDGLHFPLTTAAFEEKELVPPAWDCLPGDDPCQQSNQCLKDQCERNQREWEGGVVKESQLEDLIKSDPGDQCAAYMILSQLNTSGDIVCAHQTPSPPSCGFDPAIAYWDQCTVSSAFSSSQKLSERFTDWFDAQYSDEKPSQLKKDLNSITAILKSDGRPYQLFYDMVALGTKQYTLTAPTVKNHPERNKELSSEVLLRCETANNPQQCTSGNPTACNKDLHLQYDLTRNGVYGHTVPPNADLSTFPIDPLQKNAQGQNEQAAMAWQWRATAGISTAQNKDNGVAIDREDHQFPAYDVDGDLKEETVYRVGVCNDANKWKAGVAKGAPNGWITVDCTPGNEVVQYEDFQDGDMDTTWDSNSCAPKPGLQSNFRVYTFDQDGTYLELKDGKWYNPETQQTVRSVNRRNQIDFIQRVFQLSNDTGRFCHHDSTVGSPTYGQYVPQLLVGPGCPEKDPYCLPDQRTACPDGSDPACPAGEPKCLPSPSTCPAGAEPNPVELCDDGSNSGNGCFATENNLKETCFYKPTNMLFIRVRLKDVRGRSWTTDVSGNLGIK